ncbi:hypothetical protein BXZ70DRAFT_954983 [Cristinia sonorae]|uniref:Signal recognition particle subunit SRP72 n=1 Tax=Cristinia sonorae TaxID=1940300 RepID=A0A8K0UGG7_9AGAR|nr:hypothetical protein BXZ70DRAFT_954983 [Cristinia sonorae]
MPPKPTAKPNRQPNTSGKKAAVKTPKQPLPLPDRLKRLFTSLCAQIEGGHFTNAVKTCDKILLLDPADQDALQTKLYLLLQTEQYAAALALIEDNGENNFERMYSLYRLQREEEVESALAELKETSNEIDRGVIHLEAQLSYRQGSYQNAFDLYNELLDTTEPDTEEHTDILTNLEATQKHLDFINSGFSRALSALPAAVTASLETVPPPPPAQSSSLLASAQIIEEKKAAAPQEKKVRFKRVPKGVVPGVTPPPDPERWLKKSERTSFHSGHKRKKGGGGGGATQGVMESPAVPTSGGGVAGGASKGKGKKKK